MPKPKTCLTTKNGRPNEANKEKECFDERQGQRENLVPLLRPSSFFNIVKKGGILDRVYFRGE